MRAKFIISLAVAVAAVVNPVLFAIPCIVCAISLQKGGLS